MPSKHLELRFQDILDSINDIESFVAGLSKKAFQADRKTRLAVERSISIISEAAVKLSDDAALYASNIIWSEVRGIGNVIRHAYDTVSIDVIWGIVEFDLPKLRVACENAIERIQLSDPPTKGNGNSEPTT